MILWLIGELLTTFFRLTYDFFAESPTIAV